MKYRKLADAFQYVDDKYLDIAEEAVHDARAYQCPKLRRWVNWGALAACACIIVVAAFLISQRSPDDISIQVYSLSQAEQMKVQLIEWQDEGFKAVVVDVGNNSIFPVGAELTVVFEKNTKIILNDGSFYDYDPAEPSARNVGWATGGTILIEFINYEAEAYIEENYIYNRVYASRAEEQPLTS